MPTIAAQPGDRIELSDVLLVSDDGEVTVGSPNVAGALVVVEVLDHGKGKKVVNFKYKAKVRYRRKRGHRQGFTRLRIAEVRLGSKVAKAADRATRPQAEAETPEAAVEVPAAAETPRAVPTGRRNRTVRAAATEETPTAEAATEETAVTESETPTGRRRRPAASTEESSED